jgi:lipoprotein-anchoring transpeptidase ErfK/SrfK
LNRKFLSVFLVFLLVIPAAFAASAETTPASAPAVKAAAPATAPAVPAAAAAAPAAAEPAPAVSAPAPVDPSLAPVETPAFKTLFSPAADAQSTVYEVKSGDNLTSIAKKHHVTAGVIKRVNGLATDRLRPAQKLKIPTAKFSIVVDKSQNTLLLKGDEAILKTYRVSTGENNGTPVGVFKVTDMLKDPVWYKENKNGASYKIPAGSPKNLLGTRWIGIDKPGYGIHGTIEPEKLGTQCTQGCVRMRNEEVEELYDIVPPGTEVTIVD